MFSIALASFLAVSASSRIVSDLLRDDPRIGFSAKGGHLLPREAKAFQVDVRAIEVVEWRVRPIDPEMFRPSREKSVRSQGDDEGSEVEGSERWNDESESVDDVVDDGIPRKWIHRGRARRPSGALSSWSFLLDLDSLRRLNPGRFLQLEVVGAPKDLLPAIDSSVCDSVRIGDVFQVSGLGLYATLLGSDSMDVLAVDLESYRPWPGVVVRPVGESRRLFRTGRGGSLRLARTQETSHWIGLAGKGDVAVLVTEEDSPWGQHLEVGLQLDGQQGERLWKKGVRVHPYLLRGVHAPGDTVVAGFLVRGPGGSIPSSAAFKTRLCHRGNCLDSIELVAGKRGHVQWRTVLPENAPTGAWSIEVSEDAEPEMVGFRVEVFQSPRLGLGARILAKQDDSGKCLLELSGRWLSGRPASGKPFQAELRRFGPQIPESSWTVEGRLDAKGSALVALVCDSMVAATRWGLRLSVEEAAGRKTRESFDHLYFPVQPEEGSKSPATSVEKDREGWGRYRYPEEISPTRIRVGEIARTRWEAASDGLALLQVVQGDRILRQRVERVRRGRQIWSERSDSTWTPFVHLVVSVLGEGGDHARWVRADGRTLNVLPRESPMRFSMETDSVFAPKSTARVTLRNGSRRTASVVVSAVDEGILSLDGFRPDVPLDWFSVMERLDMSWWDGLGRRHRPYSRWTQQECRTTDGLLGDGGDGEMGRMALGAGESGNSFAYRRRLAAKDSSRSVSIRRFAWSSRVLDLPPGETIVEFPVGEYTGALRIFAMAISGMEASLLETSTPVRHPVELKLTAPMAVSPGDTFEVAATALVGAARDVSVDISAENLSILDGMSNQPVRPDSSGDLERRARLVAPDSTGDALVVASAVSGGASSRDHEVVRIADDRSLVSLSTFGRADRENSIRLSLGAVFLPGSSPARLELSSGPVVGLDKIWKSLLAYPHGCLEQTLSTAFPQLFLDRLFPQMSAKERDSAAMHVRKAVAKMENFQKSVGLMSLWPNDGDFHPWGSVWALDFLQEVGRSDSSIGRATLERLQDALRKVNLNVPFEEAYRLALLDSADSRVTASIGRSLDSLLALDQDGAMPWMLARAARRQGLSSRRWLDSAHARIPLLSGWSRMGMESSVSARAMALEAAVVLGDSAVVGRLVDSVARDIASSEWLSTRDMGTQLRALALSGWTRKVDTSLRPSVSWDGWNWRTVDLDAGRTVLEVPLAVDTVHVRVEGSKRMVGALLHRSGRIAFRGGRPSGGLSLDVLHMPDSVLREGQEDSVVFLARNGTSSTQDDVAATLWMPGGWQVPLDATEGLRARFREADIRSDRVSMHFRLEVGQARLIVVPVSARNAGNYRGAALHLEALYDASLYDAWEGGRVRVETAAP